jgi:hypothetical protein
MHIPRHLFLYMLLVASLILAAGHVAAAADDPLPSWHDGAAKRAIVDFVQRVTTPGGTDFVPAPERIATFDNDGTLRAEQPLYFQLAFAFDRVKALAPHHPEWQDQGALQVPPRWRPQRCACWWRKGVSAAGNGLACWHDD